MAEEKRSKFEESMVDEPVDSEVAAIEGDDESQGFAPRAIFVAGAKPDLSKMQIPQLRVAQGMTQEVTDRKAQIGQFVLSNFAPMDQVEIVPLGAVNVRTYKPDPKKPPLCHAPGPIEVEPGVFKLHGVGDPGILCEVCPLAKWGPKVEGKKTNTPPPCKEGVAMRGYSLTHRTLVDFQFMGRNQGKGTFIQSQLMAWGEGQFVVRLTSAATKNDRGQWFEPTVEMLGPVPEEHQAAVGRWLELHHASVISSDQATAILGLSA